MASSLKSLAFFVKKKAPSSGVNSPSGGVAYTSALIDYTSEQIQNSDIVKEQEANPTINVFTGKEFAKDPKPFNSADLTEEEKIQLVKLTPEQQAQYIQQYNENSAANLRGKPRKTRCHRQIQTGCHRVLHLFVPTKTRVEGFHQRL